jgi:hypothetical protein
MNDTGNKKRVAIACQGGGSHTAFTAGVLKGRLRSGTLQEREVVALSGTSGGAVGALLGGDAAGAAEDLEAFWRDNSATAPHEQIMNSWILWASTLQNFVATPALSPYYNPFATMGLEVGILGLLPFHEGGDQQQDAEYQQQGGDDEPLAAFGGRLHRGAEDKPKEKPLNQAHGDAAGHEAQGLDQPAIALKQDQHRDDVKRHHRGAHDYGQQIDDDVTHDAPAEPDSERLPLILPTKLERWYGAGQPPALSEY